MKLTLLHISSEYTANKLYKNFVSELNKYEVKQKIYASIKDDSLINKNFINSNNVIIKYSDLLKFYHRFFYFKKINFLHQDVLRKIKVNDTQLIHAHKLFSDGGVAYKLYKRFGIPYIVAIRNTDINFFYKYMPWLKPFALNILYNSQYVILLNHYYKEELKRLHKDKYDLFKNKIRVIPNGIEPIWFNYHRYYIKDIPSKEKPFNLVYVGLFSKRKQVPLLIDQIKKLNDKGNNIKLTLIGGGGNEHDKVLSLIRDKEYITFLGRLDFNEMIKLYKDMHALIMLSKRETFGLVYIEAISQGLPIIYTKGESIDSYFEDGEVGFSVNPQNSYEIIESIENIRNSYESISENCKAAAKEFNWKDITMKYLSIYKDAVS